MCVFVFMSGKEVRQSAGRDGQTSLEEEKSILRKHDDLGRECIERRSLETEYYW